MYQMAKKARNNCLEIRCLGSKLFIALIRRRITVKCVISRALFNIKIVACVFFGPLLSIVPISVFDISLLKASADVQFVCLDALLFFFVIRNGWHVDFQVNIVNLTSRSESSYKITNSFCHMNSLPFISNPLDTHFSDFFRPRGPKGSD